MKSYLKKLRARKVLFCGILTFSLVVGSGAGTIPFNSSVFADEMSQEQEYVSSNIISAEESEESAVGNADYPVDTTQGVSLTNIYMKGESYRGEFSAIVNTGENAQDDQQGELYFIYTSDASADLFSGKSVVTAEELYSTSGVKVSGESGFGFDDGMKHTGYLEASDANGDSYPDALLPNTTYYYRAVYNTGHSYPLNGQCYFLTGRNSFSTAQAVNSTSVQISGVEKETGYFGAKVTYTLSNPNDEWIIGYMDTVEIDGEDENVINCSSGKDGNKYTSSDISIYGNTNRFKGYANIYTGTTPVLTRIATENYELVPKNFDPETNIKNISVTATASKIEADLELEPSYSVDSLCYDEELYYRKQGETDYSTDTYKQLENNTTYEYYYVIKTKNEVVYSYGTADSPKTIKTVEFSDREYTSEDFPDESFFAFLKYEYSSEDDKSKLMASDLEKVDWLYIQPEYLKDAGINKPIKSIQGVELMNNLKKIDLNGMDIEDASCVTGLKKLESLDLHSNELKSLPDLSGLTALKELDFSDNYITEVSSLPAGIVLTQGDFDRRYPKKETVYADEYYAIGEKRPFVFGIRGFNSSREYNASVTINGKKSEKSLSRTSYIGDEGYYYKVFTFSDLNGDIFDNNLSEGTYNAKITVSDDFGTVIDEEKEIKFAGDSVGVRDSGNIFTSKDWISCSMYMTVPDPEKDYKKSDITNLKIVNSSGIEKLSGDEEVQVYVSKRNDQGDERYPGILRSNSLNRDILEIGLSTKEGALTESGKYSVRFTLDGKNYELKDAFEIIGEKDGAVITEADIEESNGLTDFYYSQGEEYVTVKVKGINIDAEHFYPVLKYDDVTCTEYPEKSFRKWINNKDYVWFRLKKKSNVWENPKTGRKTMELSFNSDDGYTVRDDREDKNVRFGPINTAWLENYNPATGYMEFYLTKDIPAGETTQVKVNVNYEKYTGNGVVDENHKLNVKLYDSKGGELDWEKAAASNEGRYVLITDIEFDFSGTLNKKYENSGICYAHNYSTTDTFKDIYISGSQESFPVTLSLYKAGDYKVEKQITVEYSELKSGYYSLKDEDIKGLSKGVIYDIYGESGDKRISVASSGYPVYDESKPDPVQPVVRLTGISLPISVNVAVGKTANIPVTYTPANATNKRLTWSVSDNTIATVDNGVVTGKTVGSTAVTATAEDGGYTASCRIIVTEAGDEPQPEPKPVTGRHIVKFISDGAVFGKTQSVEDGMPVSRPDKDPVKEGYTFICWINGGLEWNFNNPVTADLTLTAKFIANTPAAVSENTGSGLDPVPEIVSNTIYLVKGQIYTLNGTNWTLTDGKKFASITGAGKITAKKKGEAKVSNGTDNYTVIVAEPGFKADAFGKAKKLELMVGGSQDIKDKFAVNSPKAVDDKNYSITWSSANPKIATVNNGCVTAVAKGNVNITAYVGGKAYNARVAVSDTWKAPATQDKTDGVLEIPMNPLQSVTLKYKSGVFKIKNAKWSGDGLEPTYTRNKPDGGYANNIVKITKAGKITAIGKGTTEISAVEADNETKKIRIKVTVTPVPTKADMYINVAKSEKITFANVKNNKADWSISQNEVFAQLDSRTKGKVMGKKYGSSVVSCSYNGFVFNTRVYVENPEFNTDGNKFKKNGNKYTLTMNKGEYYNRVSIKDVFQNITFKSSKPSVAFIDENGVVYARSKGKTNITTNINGKTMKIAVTVNESK